MPLLLEFADSEILGLELGAGVLRLRFSAAHALRTQEEGKPEAGYCKGVEIVAGKADLAAVPAGCCGRVRDGRIHVEGQWQSRLALPCSIEAPLLLALTFSNGSQLTLLAQSLHCGFTGEANFAESYAC